MKQYSTLKIQVIMTIIKIHSALSVIRSSAEQKQTIVNSVVTRRAKNVHTKIESSQISQTKYS